VVICKHDVDACPQPLQAGLVITLNLQIALKVVGLRIFDHFIVAGTNRINGGAWTAVSSPVSISPADSSERQLSAKNGHFTLLLMWPKPVYHYTL